MFKKISKFTLLFLLGLQTLFAASVNDGYVEYQNGNNQQAIEIFKKACDNGASSGCYNLGLMYYNGTNVEQEYFKAAEAFAKACNTGLRAPVLLSNISVLNDELGKPYLVLAPELEQWLLAREIKAYHLSLSDERSLSSAFVVLER